LGRQVRVRTAGGTVSAEVVRLRDARLGELTLTELDVLELRSLPPGVSGLLGMDVIGRLPGGLPNLP
jgi:hypothetical protein